MTYGSTPPAITPGYAGFVNGDTAVVAHDDADAARRRPPARARCRARRITSSCTGAVDPNYAIAYARRQR